jgi:FlaA1/EpsC-like NDP-sugar epimerase
LVLATYLVAQFIAFNFDVRSIPWASLPLEVSVLLPVYALGFLHSSSYVGVVRHSGGKDFTRLFQATVEATLFLLVLSFTTAIEYNRTALVSQAMLFLILSVGGRLPCAAARSRCRRKISTIENIDITMKLSYPPDIKIPGFQIMHHRANQSFRELINPSSNLRLVDEYL